MTIQVALAVYTVVHVFGAYVLHSSGTWDVLFAPRQLGLANGGVDPLAASPRGWIENHAFWEFEADDTASVDDASEDFWGPDAQRDIG